MCVVALLVSQRIEVTKVLQVLNVDVVGVVDAVDRFHLSHRRVAVQHNKLFYILVLSNLKKIIEKKIKNIRN